MSLNVYQIVGEKGYKWLLMLASIYIIMQENVNVDSVGIRSRLSQYNAKILVQIPKQYVFTTLYLTKLFIKCMLSSTFPE